MWIIWFVGWAKAKTLNTVFAFVFQRHLCNRWELAWVPSARRETAVSWKGVECWQAESWVRGHVCKLKAHQVFSSLPAPHTSTQRADKSLYHSTGRQQTPRAKGVNTALSWAPLLNLSSLNLVVSHWNNWMERANTREIRWPRWAGWEDQVAINSCYLSWSANKQFLLSKHSIHYELLHTHILWSLCR